MDIDYATYSIFHPWGGKLGGFGSFKIFYKMEGDRDDGGCNYKNYY